MSAEPYAVRWTETSVRLLEKISARRIRQKLLDRGDDLASDPALQGKPLREELTGYRSLRAVGQRYRLLYQVDESRRTVWIKAVGLRKEGDRNDIYALAGKLVRLGYL